MPVTTVPSALAARRIREFAAVLLPLIIAAEAETLADAKRLLESASQGNVTTAELAKMGHPFATRAPQSGIDPSIINNQGGTFAQDWRSEGPFEFGLGALGDTVIRSRVVNVDPIAHFMLGTRLMIPRPIIERVRLQIKDVRLSRLRKAVSDAIAIALKTT